MRVGLLAASGRIVRWHRSACTSRAQRLAAQGQQVAAGDRMQGMSGSEPGAAGDKGPAAPWWPTQAGGSVWQGNGTKHAMWVGVPALKHLQSSPTCTRTPLPRDSSVAGLVPCSPGRHGPLGHCTRCCSCRATRSGEATGRPGGSRDPARSLAPGALGMPTCAISLLLCTAPAPSPASPSIDPAFVHPARAGHSADCTRPTGRRSRCITGDVWQ